MVGWLVNFCICHVRYFCMLFLKRTSKIMGALVPTKPETLGPSAPPGPLTCSRYFSSLPSAPGGELDKPLQAPMTPGFCWTRPVGSHPPPEDWTERKRFLAGRYSPGSSVRSPPVGWVPSLKATAPWLSCGLAVSASPALPWCLRSSAENHRLLVNLQFLLHSCGFHPTPLRVNSLQINLLKLSSFTCPFTCPLLPGDPDGNTCTR